MAARSCYLAHPLKRLTLEPDFLLFVNDPGLVSHNITANLSLLGSVVAFAGGEAEGGDGGLFVGV
jgi:hypothetical protein